MVLRGFVEDLYVWGKLGWFGGGVMAPRQVSIPLGGPSVSQRLPEPRFSGVIHDESLVTWTLKHYTLGARQGPFFPVWFLGCSLQVKEVRHVPWKHALKSIRFGKSMRMSAEKRLDEGCMPVKTRRRILHAKATVEGYDGHVQVSRRRIRRVSCCTKIRRVAWPLRNKKSYLARIHGGAATEGSGGLVVREAESSRNDRVSPSLLMRRGIPLYPASS